MKRIAIALSVLIVLSMLLSACGTAATATPAATVAATEAAPLLLLKQLPVQPPKFPLAALFSPAMRPCTSTVSSGVQLFVGTRTPPTATMLWQSPSRITPV